MEEKTLWFVDIPLLGRPRKNKVFLLRSGVQNAQPEGPNYIRATRMLGVQGNTGLERTDLVFFLKRTCFKQTTDNVRKFNGKMILSDPDNLRDTTVSIKCNCCETVYNLVHN